MQSIKAAKNYQEKGMFTGRYGKERKADSMGGQTQGQNHEDEESDEGEFEIFFPKEVQNREKDPGIGSENEHGDAQGHRPERLLLRAPSAQEIIEEIEEIFFLEEHDLFLGYGQAPEFSVEEENPDCDENQAGDHPGAKQEADGQLKLRFARIPVGRAQREITPL
jgi:hypothetical protein